MLCSKEERPLVRCCVCRENVNVGWSGSKRNSSSTATHGGKHAGRGFMLRVRGGVGHG